jgi:hypothetical protein
VAERCLSPRLKRNHSVCSGLEGREGRVGEGGGGGGGVWGKDGGGGGVEARLVAQRCLSPRLKRNHSVCSGWEGLHHARNSVVFDGTIICSYRPEDGHTDDRNM